MTNVEIQNQVLKLETHKYSPEQNTLHFRNGRKFKCGWSVEFGYEHNIADSITLMRRKLNSRQILKLIS